MLSKEGDLAGSALELAGVTALPTHVSSKELERPNVACFLMGGAPRFQGYRVAEEAHAYQT